MPNIAKIISAHNKKILKDFDNKDKPKNFKLCNCKDGEATCPIVNAECQRRDVIYKAKVTVASENDINYIGATASTMKIRYSSHKCALKNRGYQKNTLSTYY